MGAQEDGAAEATGASACGESTATALPGVPDGVPAVPGEAARGEAAALEVAACGVVVQVEVARFGVVICSVSPRQEEEAGACNPASTWDADAKLL